MNELFEKLHDVIAVLEDEWTDAEQAGDDVWKQRYAEMIEAVRTACAMLTPRARVLAYDDATNAPDFAMWLEDRGHNRRVELVLNNGAMDEDVLYRDCAGNIIVRDKWDYGVLWRCWTARPKDEQREATPWQD